MKNPYSTLSLVVPILSLSLAGCASTQRDGINPAQAVGPTAVAKPGRYLVKLLNTGQMPHDISFPDGAKISAAAGAIAVGEVEVPEDGIGFICSEAVNLSIVTSANRCEAKTVGRPT